ncbi:MAG: long-chain-fatty-acid--CoA ligase [Methylobacterium mesophilicum]|nr:long-chain-fatty-acid--CoA ligase [Methylobacterium mesophilicum]
MRGLMQEWPLTCGRILDHAARQHGGRAVVSRSVEGPITATTYAEIRNRSLKLASRLAQDGFGSGDPVATLAWNTARHLEVWYGAMGIGALYHTLNPRLFPDQLAWIMGDARDKALFVDLSFVPLAEKLVPQVPSIRRVVVLTDREHMPETTLAGAVAYEDYLAEGEDGFQWVELEENHAAGMCYTSGTTGNPKGVVYSHRSNVLHAMIAAMPDAMGISSRDVVLPVVPMFHANAWGLAQSAPMVGAKLVMPGAKLDGASLYELMERERVTFSAAVPTIWLMLLHYLEESGKQLPHLQKVVIGGAACPRAVTEKFEKTYGVEVVHAWGMTEMSPLGSLCTMKPETDGLDDDALYAVKAKQGHAPFGVEMKVTDDDNRELPWDGKSFGRLKVRGPAVSSAYFGGAGAEQFEADGWFDTGDVAHIDPHGIMQITDRAKDVIKSGGEWISTIELENLAVGHPEVAEAAVIGIHHPRWDERPLLVVVPKAGCAPTKESVLGTLENKVARWWMPDDVVFVKEIPHTATGKIQKRALREQFRDYSLPTA